ncbi:hypothetical protein Agsp01_14070 [Agromyces sp. NBRC 114283]|nr:hypothetical protein Agsp01_14070 [Agromyces sp. NBRC 114283]
MALLAERRDGLDDVGLRVPFADRVEEAEPLRRQQFHEFGAIHPATLAPGVPRPSRPLALTLHECQIHPRLWLALSFRGC